MPRVKFPPTPASSVDIQPKDAHQAPAKEGSFALPPAAMAAACINAAPRPQPILPATVKSGFDLPPPPTRSRRIIQMEPQQKEQPIYASWELPVRKIDQRLPENGMLTVGLQTASRAQSSLPKRTNSKKTTSTCAVSADTNGIGKKQPNSTSAAGKKMARKTAHSVIERRRRSKMNEEFAVLKDIIPACKDQEMHKLAILSASIEYLRYLEQCVSDLKAANTSMVQPSPPRLKTALSSYQDEDHDDMDEDQEMEDTPTRTSPELHTSSPHSLAASPPLSALHSSRSSYASSVATLPSPVFGPNSYTGYLKSTHSTSPTSPTILPGNAHDADHEATAALLMLNKDRRNGKMSSSGRSMSVKDLLSPA